MRPGALPLFDRVAGWLANRVQGWVAGLGLVLFVLFIVVVLPAQAATGSFYTGRYPAPDTEWWYTAQDLYLAAEAWGEAGRSAYVRARVTFDVVWPLAYGIFLLTGLTWVWARATSPGSRWRRIALLPILVVLLDYAENFCTATVVARYPARTPVLAELAPVFTAAKWVTLTSCFALLLVGLGAALVTGIRRRRNR
ncbi:MAG TPA: hypothetical protein VIT65_17955 [Microlunatus sp.]